ncbi:MBL fold metallo-hydrolase [Virgibacillus ndiopensis]|uniref:MBL fold metallo-hydrolase n=1 Tax=Virgibacillus ndiopensis TaxID=2004408 RepID=UPI00159BB18B|nr:MBL fold metallo-hydrolase [Virgibacillus ndiopensis]
MNIKGMSVGPIGTNCYIVYDEKNAVVIDPGGDAEIIMSFLEHEHIKPQAILLTHAHFDHIGAVDTLRNHFNINVYLHENEMDWLSDSELNGSKLFMGQPFVTKKAEHVLKPGKLCISTFIFEVVHTPGHSPGSVSFILHDESSIIGGDVLFLHGIGRTDLPGGDMRQLAASIRNEFYRLDDNYVVYPGHGAETTIGEEKRNNPFVK